MTTATKTNEQPPSNEPEAADFLEFDDEGAAKEPTELGGATANPTDTPGQRLPEDTGMSQYEKELKDAFDIEDPSDKPAEQPKAEEKKPTEESEPEGEEQESEDDEIISLAVSQGITEEAARNWPGGAKGLAQAIQYGQYLVGASRGAAQDTPPAQQPQAGDGKKTEPIEEFKLELDEDKYEPEIIELVQGVVKGANQHFSKYGERVSELEGRLNSLIEGVRAESTSRTLQEFDRTIADLGDDVVPMLGKGATLSLHKNSKAYQNREKVAQALVAMGKMFDREGLSASERMQRAVDAALGNQSTKNATRKLSKQLRDTAGRFTNRAPQRGRQTVGASAGMDPEKEAKDFVKEFMRESGMEDEDGYV